VLTGCLSLGVPVGRRRGDYVTLDKRFLEPFFQTGSNSNPDYFRISFLIPFQEETFIRNIIIILGTNCTILICIKDGRIILR
jgi:hypothetical protein